MHIYADQISQVTLSNNNVRVQLTQRGPNNETIDVGTLILPTNLGSEVNSMCSWSPRSQKNRTTI